MQQCFLAKNSPIKRKGFIFKPIFRNIYLSSSVIPSLSISGCWDISDFSSSERSFSALAFFSSACDNMPRVNINKSLTSASQFSTAMAPPQHHTMDNLMLVLLIAASVDLKFLFSERSCFRSLVSSISSLDLAFVVLQLLSLSSSEVSFDVIQSVHRLSISPRFLRSSIAEETADGRKSFPRYNTINSLSRESKVPPVSHYNKLF